MPTMQMLLRLRFFQVGAAGVAGQPVGLQGLLGGGALEGAELGGLDDLAHLIDGFAVGRQDALGAGVDGHGNVVRVGNGDAHDGHDADGVEHGQVVAELAAAAGAVLGVDDDVVQADVVQDGYPAWLRLMLIMVPKIRPPSCRVFLRSAPLIGVFALAGDG